MMRKTVNRRWITALVLAVVGSLFGGVAIATYYQRATNAEQAASVGLSVVRDVREACAVEDGNPDQDAIRDSGLCDTAAKAEKQIVESPASVAEPGRDGRNGLNGRDGTDGQDGAAGVAGGQGRPPTAAEISAAVAAFCATRNDCAGRAGLDGTNGSNGTNAPVITDIVCDGTTGRFTFSDGSTIDVADMCAGPPLLPDPEPTD